MTRQDLERVSLLGEQDLYLFNEGSHLRLWEHLGAHPLEGGGVVFGVWAPSAERVSVIGDFNGWDKNANGLYPREQSGIWEGFIPTVGHGAVYEANLPDGCKNTEPRTS